MSRLTPLRALVTAVAALTTSLAPAQQSYDLRVFSVAAGWQCCGQPAATSFEDLFNNGDPLVGGVYGGTVTGSGSYSAVNAGFSPGAELDGPAPDLPGTLGGIGRLRLSLADATPAPSNLDTPGNVSMTNRLALNDPGPGSLLNRAESFEVTLTWNFTTPDAGSYYGLRLNDNPSLVLTPGIAFNDLIDLRVVRGSAGQPMVNVRRLSFDGATLTASDSLSMSVAGSLLPGYTLADVAFIQLTQHFQADPVGQPYLWPSFTLVGSALDLVGQGSFTQPLTLFNGEDVTRASAGVSYTVAVPEPAAATLLFAGLLALGVLRRRAG